MKTKIIILILTLTQMCSGQESFLDFNTAKKSATEQSKSILMVFSGSDWCKPCIQFKKEILESDAFQKIGQDLILLYLDFPYKRQNALSEDHLAHNEALAEEYNSEGSFPKILLLDKEGMVLRKLEYSKAMTPESFIHDLNIRKAN